MKLNNTIILPVDDQELSKKMLSSLIQKEDVIIAVIFGKGANAEDAITKTDVRASAVIAGISRKAVWMRDIGMLDFLKTLIKPGLTFNPSDINPDQHIGITVSMTDKLMYIIPTTPAPDFVRIELAFLEASTIN